MWLLTSLHRSNCEHFWKLPHLILDKIFSPNCIFPTSIADTVCPIPLSLLHRCFRKSSMIIFSLTNLSFNWKRLLAQALCVLCAVGLVCKTNLLNSYKSLHKKSNTRNCCYLAKTNLKVLSCRWAEESNMLFISATQTNLSRKAPLENISSTFCSK